MALVMNARSFSDSLRTQWVIAGARLRSWRSRLRNASLFRYAVLSGGADRLLLAPQDIRTADPTIANEIYQGRYSIGGHVAAVNGASPFAILPPSARWRRALVEFGWLRHLRASNSALARAQARSLINEWIASEGRGGPSWEPEITARRIIAWLCHSPLILEGADRAYYRRFLRNLGQQVRYLRRTAKDAPDGMPRLTAAIALSYAGLCIHGMDRAQRSAARWLDDELSRQILPDGGHISRNPAVLIELLLDLLPLRQTFTARSIEPPAALIHAIDRMMPMIRFFRHGDGSFALFNGMSATPADEVATVLAYDDAFGKPLGNASHSGYQRMEADTMVVLMDTGRPPPMALSAEAHAGCLSFEMSTGRQRIVVNCGAPVTGGPSWRNAARVTAAHSTVTLADSSSCRFFADERYADMIGEPILSGPGHVKIERRNGDGVSVTASHDGYRQRFGVNHVRRVAVDAGGSRLAGEDHLIGTKTAERANPPFALRFHLHPDVDPLLADDGNTVILRLRDGERWSFVSPGSDILVEESVFLAERNGPRRSSQIVIYGAFAERPRIAWTFERLVAAENMAYAMRVLSEEEAQGGAPEPE